MQEKYSGKGAIHAQILHSESYNNHSVKLYSEFWDLRLN